MHTRKIFGFFVLIAHKLRKTDDLRPLYMYGGTLCDISLHVHMNLYNDSIYFSFLQINFVKICIG